MTPEINPFGNLHGEVPPAEVRRILAIDTGNFQSYLSRDLLPCEFYKQGSRSYRRFLLRDVPFFTLAGSLLLADLPIGSAVRVAHAFLRAVAEERDNGGDLSSSYFLYADDRVEWGRDSAEVARVMRDVFRNAAVLLIDVDQFVDRLQENLMAIERAAR